MGRPRKEVQLVSEAQPGIQAVVDMVNNVSHYNGRKCADAIREALGREQYIGFLRGTVIKYSWRTGKKDDALQDAQKLAWYQDELIEVLSE